MAIDPARMYLPQNRCVSANRPTQFFVQTLPFLWPSIKNEKIVILTDPNIFKNIEQTVKRNVRIAKIMLKTKFF